MMKKIQSVFAGLTVLALGWALGPLLDQYDDFRASRQRERERQEREKMLDYYAAGTRPLGKSTWG